MSALYLAETKRHLEALTLDELEDLQRYLVGVVVRRRHVVRGLDADELELERRDTEPGEWSDYAPACRCGDCTACLRRPPRDTDPAPTPRAPITQGDSDR
jgi:hypothetical protein